MFLHIKKNMTLCMTISVFSIDLQISLSPAEIGIDS